MDTERAFRFEQTDSVPVFGTLGTYFSSGYVVDLTEEYQDVLLQIQVFHFAIFWLTRKLEFALTTFVLEH